MKTQAALPPTLAPREARLLTLDEAAAYMSLPLATVRKLGIGRVSLGTRVRYDRLAIDAHLDALRGVAPELPRAEPDSDEAALERFTRRVSHAAGRA